MNFIKKEAAIYFQARKDAQKSVAAMHEFRLPVCTCMAQTERQLKLSPHKWRKSTMKRLKQRIIKVQCSVYTIKLFGFTVNRTTMGQYYERYTKIVSDRRTHAEGEYSDIHH